MVQDGETPQESPVSKMYDALNVRPWIMPLMIFLIAFLIRFIYILQLKAAPYFDIPLVDEETYYRTARDLIEGRGYGARPFWQPPFYPAFLAFLLMIGRGSLFAVRCFQGILGAFSCVLIYHIGKAFFERKVAFTAGIISAFYGLLIYFDGTLLAPSLLIFLILLSFYMAVRAQEKGRLMSWGTAGFLFGLAGITWASILIFAPVFLGWAYLSGFRDENPSRALFRSGVLFIGLLIAILPVTFYNGLAGDDWVLISTNGGINFYIGNNEKSDETISIRPGYPWQRLVDRPWYEERVKRPGEDSSFFYRKGLSYLAAKPHHFTGRLLVKLYRFWNGAEVSRNVYIYDTTRYSWLLRTLFWPTRTFCFPFGLLCPLAILGFIFSWKNRASLYPLFGFVGALCLAVVLFFVTSRYRAPVLPFLFLFAAYALFELIHIWKEGRLSQFRLGANLLIILLIVCNLPFFRPKAPAPAEIPYLAALTLDGRGNKAHAAAFCRRAVKKNSSFYPALMKQGEIAYQKGDLEEAHAFLKQAIALAPESPEAHGQFGIVLSAMGYNDAALVSFRRAVALDPFKESFHYNLALCLINLGHLDEAVKTLKETADLAMDENASYPKIVEAVNRVAESMMGDKYHERALVLLDWARSLMPRDTRALKNIIVAHRI